MPKTKRHMHSTVCSLPLSPQVNHDLKAFKKDAQELLDKLKGEADGQEVRMARDLTTRCVIWASELHIQVHYLHSHLQTAVHDEHDILHPTHAYRIYSIADECLGCTLEEFKLAVMDIVDILEEDRSKV